MRSNDVLFPALERRASLLLCLSVSLYVVAIIFESLDLQTSYW